MPLLTLIVGVTWNQDHQHRTKRWTLFFALKRSQPAHCNGRGGAVRERCYFEIPEWPMHLEKKKDILGLFHLGLFQ